MYMLPKSVLSTLPTGADFISDGNHSRLSGSDCVFTSGGSMNALGFALYAGGIVGGYYAGRALLGKNLLSGLVGSGIGYFAAFTVSMRDMFCEGF